MVWVSPRAVLRMFSDLRDVQGQDWKIMWCPSVALLSPTQFPSSDRSVFTVNDIMNHITTSTAVANELSIK